MKHRYWLFAGLAVIAVAAAYFLGRANAPAAAVTAKPDEAAGEVAAAAIKSPPSATKPRIAASKGDPLPPIGRPLKDTFADLQARANAGDAAAAARLFRDINRCSHLRNSELRNAGATEDLTNKKTEGMTPEQLRTYQILLDAMDLRQQAVRETQALCADASKEMLDSLVPNIAQAAELGDEDARACYLSNGPLYDTRSVLDHPELLQNYRDSAKSMIDAGLAAGDWKVVDLLQHAYEPGAQGLLAALVGADPVQHYRYLKLYRMGAESHRTDRIDQELASAASTLTPAQIADADEWAQAKSRTNFNTPSTSATPEGWNPCALPGN